MENKKTSSPIAWKCKFSVLLGNFARQTDQPTNESIDQPMEVTLPIKRTLKQNEKTYIKK